MNSGNKDRVCGKVQANCFSKKTFWRRVQALSVFLGVTSAIVSASADVITYNLTGFTAGGYSVAIHTTATEVPQIGQLIFSSGNSTYGNPLLSYCTDVAAPLQSQFNYTPMSLAQAVTVDQSWIAGGGVNAATLWFNDKGAATTAQQTVGLQLAIWELLYNAPVSSYTAATFTSHNNGGYYVASTDANTIAAENYAAGILNNFSTLPALDGQVIWLAPTLPDGSIGGSQGLFAVAAAASVPDSVPAYLILGFALFTLGIAKRKFTKENLQHSCSV